MTYKELKQEAYEANMEIPKQGLAIYTFGNASAFDPDLAVFAIKPSGIPYDDLSPEKMVVVDLEDRVVEGRLRPSSDTKTHGVLYQAFTEIRGICHTHSTYAVAWAQARKEIPVFGTTHADHLAAPVPVTLPMSDEAIQGDYEKQTGYQILDRFKNLDYKTIEMVLIAGHGPVTWGKDAMKAVYNGRVLEEIAQMAYLTLAINPEAKEISKSLLDKHYDRKHGSKAYYGQSSGEGRKK